MDKLGFYDDSGGLLLDLKLTGDGEWNLYSPLGMRSSRDSRRVVRADQSV